LPFGRYVGKESLYAVRTCLSGVDRLEKTNILLDPVQVCLLGSVGIVPGAQRIPDGVVEIHFVLLAFFVRPLSLHSKRIQIAAYK
jgi:hypothetical protein